MEMKKAVAWSCHEREKAEIKNIPLYRMKMNMGIGSRVGIQTKGTFPLVICEAG